MPLNLFNRKTTTTKDNLFDKTIKFLQDFFKSHREELTALQNLSEAQELMIKLLKIPNDSYEHGINSLREVEFKSLCDLMSIQTWQVKCAVNGFEKLTSWLCNAIETSKTNLPSAWMTLGEQLKRTNDPTQTNRKSTTTSTKTVKEIIDAIKREIAEMNEKYKHADQVLKDNVDKLEETNRQLLSYLDRYEEDVKTRLGINDNLEQQIDEWKTTKEKVHSESDTAKAENNKFGDVSQPYEPSPAPSTDTKGNKKQESVEAKVESRKTIEQTKSTIENNQYEKIAGHLQDLFGAHHNDVRLMLTTINALKIMTGLQKARNANCNKDVDEHTNTDDFSALKYMMSIHACLLKCAKNMFLTTKGLLSDATDVPKTPAAQDKNVPIDSKSRTTDEEYIKNMIDTVTRVHHTIEMYRFFLPEGNGLIPNIFNVEVLEDLEKLLIFIKRKEKGKNELEQRESNLEHEPKDEIEMSEKKEKKGKKQIVTLQLYHTRKDEVMMKVMDELDHNIKQRLSSKKKKINANIEYCNTPDQLKPNIPVLVLCINASRLKHDVEAAIKEINIKDPRYAALVVFYHIDVNVTPLQKGSIVGNVSSSFDSTHHMAFLTSKGIYECEENTDALKGMVSFLKKHSTGMA